MEGEWNKLKPLKNTLSGLWDTNWFKPKWLLGRAEDVNTKEEQRIGSLSEFFTNSYVLPFPQSKM